MKKPDRRALQTRERLQHALLALVHEGGYNRATVQAIVDRAGVGRATFYLHYSGKDELFLSCHEAMVGAFQVWPHYRLSRAELLSPDPPAGMADAYQHLAESRSLVQRILRGKDGPLILRRLRDRSAQAIEANLHVVFAEDISTIPVDVLAAYLAGAQMALVQWWVESPRPHAPDHLARTCHRLQRAAIRDAFGLEDGA